MARPRYNLSPRVPYDPTALLGPELVARGGGRVMAEMARVGQLGNYALEQQAVIDTTLRQTQTSYLGVPGTPPLPTKLGGTLPPGFADELTGAFKLPDHIRRQMEQMQVDPDDIEKTVNRNLLTRQGADYKQRLLFGQQAATAPDKSLQQAKEELFAKVARAVQADPSQRDRIFEAAFTGPGADQLLAEYDAQLAKDSHDTGLIDRLQSAPGKLWTAFGQLTQGVQGGADLLRQSIGVLTGARDEQGRPLTAASVAKQAAELPKDVLNFFTLGTTGAMYPGLRSTSAVGSEQIARTMRTRGRGDEVANLLNPLLGLSRVTSQIDHPVAQVAATGFGLASDIALDPTTYLTLGAGGLGKGATAAAGNMAERGMILKTLGADDMIPKLAKGGIGEDAWELFLREAPEHFGPKAVAAAEDAAKAFRISAENAHGTQGWAGYKALLQSQGLDADAMFPRGVLALGPDAKLAPGLVGVRGGAGLRGGVGIPWTPLQIRGALNLKGGTSLAVKARPGAWFTKEGNKFHQLASATLNQISSTFHYGAEGVDREWIHNNPGMFNATMEAGTLGQGVDHRYGVLADEAMTISKRKIGSWIGKDPENHVRLWDVLEKGERSPYWTMIDRDVRDAAERLYEMGNLAKSMGLEDGVDIPMLREATKDRDSEQFLRYFPRKVLTEISELAGIPVTPTQISQARARKLRAGTNITGPQGTSAMLTEGSYAEITDVMKQIVGEGIYEVNPAEVMAAYLRSVGKAASLNRTYRALTESGLLVPDVWDIAPGQLRKGTDVVRGIWSQPGERAQVAVKAAQASVAVRDAELLAATTARAKGMAAEAQAEAELAMYASRHADADSRISALRKTVAERKTMLAVARRKHAASKAESVALHKATRRQLIDTARTQLGQTKEERKLVQAQIRRLDSQHAQAMAEFDRGLAAQEEVLTTTPAALERDLRAQLATEARASVGGQRSFADVQNELRATKHRLAQVQGGEYPMGARKVITRAMKGRAAKREEVVARQQVAGREAANLNDQISDAEAAVREAVKASDPAAETVARTRLTALMADRTKVLQEAEVHTAAAAELWEILDAGEGVMRMADLREAEVNAHKAGAILEAQIGRMSEKTRLLMVKLLEDHAADLVRAANNMIADAPRLKWLLRVQKEFSVIDTSLPAMPTRGVSRAVADFAQEYMARVEQQGAEILDSYATAAGTRDDMIATYDSARGDYLHKQSTLLAREQELVAELSKARALDPQARVASTHQIQGDELNLFQAELHRDERALEFWMENRHEVRETQALKAVQLGAIMKENKPLADAVGAAQELLEKDAVIAAQALERAMTDPRIFDLMKPEVEHLSVVVARLPFMEGGAAMPHEVHKVIQNLLENPRQGQDNFLKVLNFANRHWKRAVLSTPGSLVRRWFGNAYNAVVLAGVRPESFQKAYEAMGRSRQVKNLSDISDPKLRRYMELAHEYNIFEGQISALAEDTKRYTTGAGHPFQSAGKLLQDYAMRGEDIARLAQFIDGLDSGMGPAASRLWTGKYHFFNNELTERERTTLRPLYPFYAYLRNNYALQFYTLFHQPGKISLYGHAARDLSAQPEGSTAPGWVEQSGGFPITKDLWLQNTMLDTSPLGLAQTVVGLAGRGPGSGFNPADLARGELTSSASPVLQAGASVLWGIDPSTGEKMYPQELGPSAKPIEGFLKALGVVNDGGRINPRVLAAYQTLPWASRLSRAGGGATPAQGDQRLWWAIGQLAGPNIAKQTERRERSAYGERGRVLDDLLASMTARLGEENVPTTGDLTRQERTKLALQRLGIGP